MVVQERLQPASHHIPQTLAAALHLRDCFAVCPCYLYSQPIKLPYNCVRACFSFCTGSKPILNHLMMNPAHRANSSKEFSKDLTYPFSKCFSVRPPLRRWEVMPRLLAARVNAIFSAHPSYQQFNGSTLTNV